MGELRSAQMIILDSMKGAFLQGSLIKLVPATLEDRRSVYEWLAHSDITSSIMGPPVFTDHPIPTYEEFCADYLPHFFDGSQPERGGSFIIEANGTQAGHINHNDIDRLHKSVELDIWMRDKAHCNKGYGTDALNVLCAYLQQTYGCEEFILAPSARNQNAIRAYLKAGFAVCSEPPVNFTPDYHDPVVMIKRLRV